MARAGLKQMTRTPEAKLGLIVRATKLGQPVGQKRSSPWVCVMSAPNRPDLSKGADCCHADSQPKASAWAWC